MMKNSSLKLIGLASNQLMASSDSDFNDSSKLVISLEVAYMVLSSAKFARLAFFMNKNKSFMNKLYSIGTNFESFGTPETNIFHRFSILLTLTFCFLLFKWEYIKTRVSI